MIRQVVADGKPAAALLTPVGPLLGVDPAMVLKVCLGDKCLGAEVTLEVLFSSMPPEVDLSVGLVPETLPADPTLEGLLLCVLPPVGLKGVSVGEVFAAQVAQEGTFSCVCSGVSVHVALLRETFTALIALEWLLPSVAPLMGGDCTFIPEGLGTVPTLENLFWSGL